MDISSAQEDSPQLHSIQKYKCSLKVVSGLQQTPCHLLWLFRETNKQTLFIPSSRKGSPAPAVVSGSVWLCAFPLSEPTPACIIENHHDKGCSSEAVFLLINHFFFFLTIYELITYSKQLTNKVSAVSQVISHKIIMKEPILKVVCLLVFMADGYPANQHFFFI